MENLYNDITTWQKETFGEATDLSKIAHLKQEVIELEQAIINEESENIGSEFADCFILLFGAASCHGMNYNDIINEIQWKMEINKKRIWGKPDANGVVNHIKESFCSCGAEHSNEAKFMGQCNYCLKQIN